MTKIKPNNELIIKLRQGLKLTQADVAKELGIARTACTAIELGQRLMAIQEAIHLAQILKTNSSHITAKVEPTLYDSIYALPMDLRLYYCRRAYRHKALSEMQIAKILKLSIIDLRTVLPINQETYLRNMKEQLDDYCMGERIHQVNLIRCGEVWIVECGVWVGEHGVISHGPNYLDKLSDELRQALMSGLPVFKKSTFWLKTELNEIDDMGRFLKVVLANDWSES